MNVVYKPDFFKFEKIFTFDNLIQMINENTLPSYNTWQENKEDVFNSVFAIDNIQEVGYFTSLFNLLNQKFNLNNKQSNLHIFPLLLFHDK